MPEERKKRPLIWIGPTARVYKRVINSLHPEDVQEIREQAETDARSLCSETGIQRGISEAPWTDEDIAHLRVVVEQELLQDAVMDRLFNEGRVVYEYSWDGTGKHTSRGSSFYACVKEWEGLFGFFSDVTSEGPFTTKKDLIITKPPQLVRHGAVLVTIASVARQSMRRRED
jgi:hypothetical protein